MNETAYWIWLLRTLGAAAPIRDIISVYGSARKLYEAGSMEWRISGILTPKQITALTKFSPSESGSVMKVCRENGWHILTPEHVCYPKALLELPNYPPVLFVWGNPEVLLEEVKLSIVGTRKASTYAVRVAYLLAESLAKCGATVVSGGALGIDSAAHTGALYAKGKTVAVLGCGLGTDYLKENAPMRRRIAESGGAVISEFLPFSPASRTTFPLRNRIISALSLGTVVVEAGERSGSLITARCAAEQGRDVFAVPGDLISTAYTGGNRLIRDGAKPVFAPMDIIEEYLYLYPETLHAEPAQMSFREMLAQHQHAEEKNDTVRVKSKTTPKSAPKRVQKTEAAQTSATAVKEHTVHPVPEFLSADAKRICALLESGAKHIDEICEALQLSIPKALAALTELELAGTAELIEGKKYRRI